MSGRVLVAVSLGSRLAALDSLFHSAIRNESPDASPLSPDGMRASFRIPEHYA